MGIDGQRRKEKIQYTIQRPVGVSVPVNGLKPRLETCPRGGERFEHKCVRYPRVVRYQENRTVFLSGSLDSATSIKLCVLLTRLSECGPIPQPYSVVHGWTPSYCVHEILLKILTLWLPQVCPIQQRLWIEQQLSSMTPCQQTTRHVPFRLLTRIRISNSNHTDLQVRVLLIKTFSCSQTMGLTSQRVRWPRGITLCRHLRVLLGHRWSPLWL